MNYGKTSIAALRLVCSAALMAAASGCIREGFDDCYVTRTVTVRAYDNAGAELGSDRVHDVTLFLFDGEGRFLEAVPARVGEPVEVTVPVNCDIDMVAWGNIAGGLQDVSYGAAWKDDYRVSLLPLSSGLQGYSSPGNLYYGAMLLPAGKGTEADLQEITLPVHSIVSSMTITLKNLDRLVGGSLDGLRVVVRETATWLDFCGVAGGDSASYHPGGAVVEGSGGSEFFVPLFNIISGHGFAIDVYRGGELLLTVTRDADGNPIVPEAGATTDIIFDASKLTVARTVTVRAYDNAGAELGSDYVRDVTLYLFDGEGRFLEAVPARVGEPVEVAVPVNCDIDMVAWGNLGGGLHNVGAGIVRKDFRVSLLPISSGLQGYSSPDDLYYGAILLPAEKAGEPSVREVTLPVHCVISGVTVTLRNLENLAGSNLDGLRVVVRETVSWLDFYGVAGGSPASYHPEGSVIEGSGGREFFVPMFNIISGHGFAMDIYRGSELLLTVTRDANGNPIVPEAGAAINILVEPGETPPPPEEHYEDATLGVSISLTPLGVYKIWKVF